MLEALGQPGARIAVRSGLGKGKSRSLARVILRSVSDRPVHGTASNCLADAPARRIFRAAPEPTTILAV